MKSTNDDDFETNQELGKEILYPEETMLQDGYYPEEEETSPPKATMTQQEKKELEEENKAREILRRNNIELYRPNHENKITFKDGSSLNLGKDGKYQYTPPQLPKKKQLVRIGEDGTIQEVVKLDENGKVVEHKLKEGCTSQLSDELLQGIKSIPFNDTTPLNEVVGAEHENKAKEVLAAIKTIIHAEQKRNLRTALEHNKKVQEPETSNNNLRPDQTPYNLQSQDKKIRHV